MPKYACNQENMLKFVRALLSGEYEQGKSKLKYTSADGVRWCCLGVAADVCLREGGVNGRWGIHDGDHAVEVFITTDADGLILSNDKYGLPLKVRDWLGIATSADLVVNGKDIPFAEYTSAIKINDSSNSFLPVIKAIMRDYF